MGLRYHDTKQVNLTYSSNHHINRPFLTPLYMSRNAGGDPLSHGKGGARTGLAISELPKCLGFKARLSAKLLIWKSHITRKVLHLVLFWKWKF